MELDEIQETTKKPSFCIHKKTPLKEKLYGKMEESRNKRISKLFKNSPDFLSPLNSFMIEKEETKTLSNPIKESPISILLSGEEKL